MSVFCLLATTCRICILHIEQDIAHKDLTTEQALTFPSKFYHINFNYARSWYQNRSFMQKGMQRDLLYFLKH